MSQPLDRRGLGRRLTSATDATVADVLSARGAAPLAESTNRHRLGITGPPGAGKSTLIGALARERSSDGRRIGILAIDPTSPHSGGSILGDRIRIDAMTDDEHLFVRSVPSRLASDGLTDNLPDLVAALEAEPFDEIWLETVGVGQASLSVRRCVDTVVVLVLPGSGDTVQAMKAGILEVGDVYVVTKADRPGADQTASELDAALALSRDDGWRPPVLLTAATTGAGIPELNGVIDRHRAHLERHGAIGHDPDRARYDVQRLLHRRVCELVETIDPTGGETLASAYRAVVQQLAIEISTPRPNREPSSLPPSQERWRT